MSACFLSIFVSRGLSSNLVRRNSILKYTFKTYINIMKLCNFPRTVNLFMYAAFAVGSPHCGAVVVLRTRPLANVKARLSASPNPVMRDNSCPDKVSLVEVTGCVAVQVCFTLDFDFKNDNWTPCMFYFLVKSFPFSHTLNGKCTYNLHINVKISGQVRNILTEWHKRKNCCKLF